jgi:regulator of sigma E protease
MITILAFLFVLGVLIFVHEFGHFLVARLYGVRVITFSLGFGPKLLKVRRGATEYCVSVIPLGGYVKLAGETVEEDLTGAPDEFLSKSKWVRFQVYLAGPTMNILLALLLTFIVLLRGADVPLYETSAPVIGSLAPGSPAEKAGLRVGDRVLRFGDRDVQTWDDLDSAVMTKANRQLEIAVRRQGALVAAHITPQAVTRYELGSLGIGPVMRPQVQMVNPTGPAARAGLERGDVLLALNGQRGPDRQQIISRIQQSAGTPIVFTIERAGQSRDITIVPEKNGATGVIGVQISALETRRVDPNVVQAVALSVRQNWDTTVQIGRTLRGLLTADTPVRQLMGPVAIAQLSGDAAQLGWLTLFQFMAMISLNLGLLNLMPVPVLDGGHIAILGFESLARRDLTTRVKERVLMVGAALIVVLMVTVVYNDVMRLMK